MRLKLKYKLLSRSQDSLQKDLVVLWCLFKCKNWLNAVHIIFCEFLFAVKPLFYLIFFSCRWLLNRYSLKPIGTGKFRIHHELDSSFLRSSWPPITTSRTTLNIKSSESIYQDDYWTQFTSLLLLYQYSDIRNDNIQSVFASAISL